MPRPPNPHPYQKTCTRWRLPSGKHVKPRTEGAIKHTEKSSTYYADVAGNVVALKTTKLNVAWKRLNDLLAGHEDRELGRHHAKATLREHLSAWLAVLQAKGTSAGARDTIEQRLVKLFALAKWDKLADITLDRAVLVLAKLTKKDGKPLSVQTRNHYITHLRGFCAWCVPDRLPSNPLLKLQKTNVEIDRRKVRREPTREELAELFHYLETAPSIRGMTGPQRALAYRLAMATGYRGRELRTLTADSFDLDARTVALSASADKRRKGDVHPLPDWLVTELREWFAKGGRAWDGFPSHFPGRVLRADLRCARNAWIKEIADKKEAKKRKESSFLAYKDGIHFFDFHSLRVYYLSELAAMPGMDIKTLMTLARHSTPHLSLAVYAKAREANVRAATNQLKPPTD